VSDCVGALLCKNYIKLKKIDLVCQKKKIILPIVSWFSGDWR
jgi:hypothetical protein